MKKTLYLILLVITVKTGFSQYITAPTASYTLSTAYTNGVANDAIFGFCTPNTIGGPVTGALSATAGQANCSFEWTVFNAAGNNYTPFTTQTGLTTSTITGLASGGYHVTIKNSAGTVIGCDLVWVWVNQTNATAVSSSTTGCTAFTLTGTASAVSNFTYYNPPPEPLIINATTTITVCFNATHTWVSDLGFYLIGPPSCGSPVVTLSPNPGSNGQGSICNNGNNVNNLCFTTLPSPNFNPCTAATPYTGTYDSYGVNPGTNINWSGLNGCNAATGGWKVQIFDCIGGDVGALTGASVSFMGNSGCGNSSISYNSGAINSAINDNSCSQASASVFNVPPTPATTPIVINNTITYQWSSVPATVITNSTTSLSQTIVPTQNAWYYLRVTDNFGCMKKDSVFFNYSPPGSPTVTVAGPFCLNSPTVSLSANPTGGTWTGTGITNSVTGTFNPATAGAGTFTVNYATPGSCGGNATTTIVVNALPTVTVPANMNICNGLAVPASTFVSNSTGATFGWTNNNTGIGLAASGTGTIASFTGANTGTAPSDAIISVVPTLNGCSGNAVSYTITIKPSPVVNAVSPVTVCNGATVPASAFSGTPAGVSYDWTNSNTTIGLAGNGSGNYASFTGANNTANPVSGVISVTPALNGCIGNAINYSVTINPIPPTPTVAIVNYCINETASPLTATTSAGGTLNWWGTNATGGTASSTGPVPSTNALGTTTYYVSQTIAGCEGPRVQVIVIISNSSTIVAPPNIVICAGDVVPLQTFTSNPLGASISWTNSDASVGLPASGMGNIPSFTAVNTGATSVITQLTVQPFIGTCMGQAITYSITIKPMPVAIVNDVVACDNASIPLIGWTSNPSGATYTWTNTIPSIGTAASGATNIPSFTALNGSANTVNALVNVVPVFNGCTGQASTFTITVNPTPPAPLVSGVVYCLGDVAIPLTANGSGLLWYAAATGGTGFGSAPLPSTAAIGTEVFYVSQTLLGCEGPRTAITSTVYGLPTGTLAPVAPQCPPLCTDLVLTSADVLNGYVWNLGDNSTYSGSATVNQHCYQSTGNYTVSVTIEDNHSCKSTLVFPAAVRVYEVPDARFNSTPNPATWIDPVVTFTSTSVGTPPMINDWRFGDSTGVVNQNGPVHTYNNPGIYIVQLTTTNAFGCKDIVENTVIVENDYTLYVPNSFTPNGDGINDGFFAQGLGIEAEGFKMEVFDRWGALIFSSDDITKPWPGTVNGKTTVAKTDVYVWKIKCKTITGKYVEKLGHVTLMR